jgi:hypothetical protein
MIPPDAAANPNAAPPPWKEPLLLMVPQSGGIWVPSSALEEERGVYFDDAGCNRSHGHEVFLWAGFIGEAPFWRQFRAEWQRILRDPPSLPYWRTASARERDPERIKPPFNALTTDQLREKERRLAQFIEACHQQMVRIVVRIPYRYLDEHVSGKILFAKFEDKNLQRELFVKVLERPHYIGFQVGVSIAVSMLKQMKGAQWRSAKPIMFKYAQMENDPFEDAAHAYHSVVRFGLPPDESRLIGGLEFIDAKSGEEPGIEAADMLAWHVGQRALRKGMDDPVWTHLAKTHCNELRVQAWHLQRYVDNWNKDLPISPEGC